MWQSMLKVAGATALYGLAHSALASRAAKQTAAHLIGDENRNRLYRAFYIAQSGLLFALLAKYIRSLPSRELYHVRGPAALAMHAVQLGGMLAAVAAARQVGVSRITGVENLSDWLQDKPVQPEPEAQGPALDQQGLPRAAGPFAWSRHPLNVAPLLVLWMWPRMTTNLLAFNLTATAYLIVGSLHEEMRLREAYGARYERYQQSGVRFYLPWPSHSSTQAAGALLSAVSDDEANDETPSAARVTAAY